MSETVINAYVFEEQHRNLISLAGAITDIGRRVNLLTSNLPDSCRAQVEELIGREMDGINATCHCLGEVALTASENAEEWKWWAQKTETHLSYDHCRGAESGTRGAATR